MTSRRYLRTLLLSSALAGFATYPVHAANFDVANEAQLRSALSSTDPSNIIRFVSDITLTGELPVINRNFTIEGNGHVLDGNNTQRGLFAYSGTTSISNLTIQNTVAAGGNGGSGHGGGGGGMGAGGGLFVNSGANVTISNVSFTNTTARGGSGGSGDGYTGGGGGGGGLGGAGGNVTTCCNAGGAGGGGLGSGATGGQAGASAGGVGQNGGSGILGSGNSGGNGGSSAVAAGGAGGADGGGGGGGGGENGAAPGPDGSGGGGGGGIGGQNGANASTSTGGNGGLFGGGGGGGAYSNIINGNAGTGGFGGGGGGGSGAGGIFDTAGGAGGYGGGGGGGGLSAGAGGFGGAGGSTSFGGGGGAGFGGAIFVSAGGSLTVNNGTQSGGGATGGSGTSAGQAAGSGYFLAGSGTLTLDVSGALTTTISGQIADERGFLASTPGYAAPVGFVAGSWGIAKTGTGTQLLSGANIYSGETQIMSGTIRAGAANSLSANSRHDVGAGTTLDLGNTDQTIGSLTGSGTVALGTGTLTTNGDNSSTTFSGSIQGDGGLIKNGTGTLTLSGDLTYHGATLINAGMLEFTSGSSGQTAVTVAAGATLGVGHVYAIGSLRGAGTVTNTATSLTSLAAGYDNSDATFSGVITDGASAALRMFIQGTGTTTFTGANTYTGGTLISPRSTLQIGDGATTGAITGRIWNGGTLIFNRSDATSFAGTIADAGDAGRVIKAGAGHLMLAGNSDYTGTTTVDAGTLSVNGSIATSSLTTVNAGATLGGTGIVGNTTINGGTLAPGNSIGTLTVQGNLVMTAGSTYLVEVSPSHADRVNVTGIATLGGATVNASFAPGSYIIRQYTILNAAGGVNGSFGAQVNSNLPDNFTSSLRTDANNVYLDLALNYAPPPRPDFGSSLTGNQRNVANTLTNYFNTNGGIPLAFGALGPSGLTLASGETATGSQQATFSAMNQFIGVMTDPFVEGRSNGTVAAADDAMAYAATRSPTDAFASLPRKASPLMPEPLQRWSVWAAGFGGSQTTDGNAVTGSNTATSRLYGTAVGADYTISPNTIAGFALAGGGTSFGVNGQGSGRSDLFQAGAFLRHTVGAAYVSAAFAYGWQDITTDRTLMLSGIDQLRAQFNANAFSGRVEAGHRVVASFAGGIGLTPYIAGQVTSFDLPSYAESLVAGTGTFALSYAGKTALAARSEVGLRADKSFALDAAVLTLRGRTAWAHDANTDRSVPATFQSLPGASFVVNGAALARNAALTTASADLKWMNGWSIAASFEGEFSDVTRSYAGKGVVRYAW